MENPIIVHHNFDGKKFKWLYAKTRPAQILKTTALTRSKENTANASQETIPISSRIRISSSTNFRSLDGMRSTSAVVSSKGYAKHLNYPHNVHIAIIPAPGETDEWSFENWKMTVKNAKFEYVISEDELDPKYKDLPEKYVTCRMFRWAVWHYRKDLENA